VVNWRTHYLWYTLLIPVADRVRSVDGVLVAMGWVAASEAETMLVQVETNCLILGREEVFQYRA
jgi:hypothetical protein